jgi:hypothetical protein
LIVVLALVVAFCLATGRLFVWPAEGAPAHVDAIVMLAGDGDTAGVALQLARQHRAPVLVVSQGWMGYGGPCPPKTSDTKVICFEPNPGNTRGEAEFIGLLAARYHWRSMVLVTIRPQDTRARFLIGRCFGGSVYVMNGSLPWSDWPYQIAYEWGALVKALALYRSCLGQQFGRHPERRREPVMLRPDGHRQRPRDGQLGVVVCDRHVLGGIVRAVDAIRHIGWVGQGLESVGTAGRHVERDLLAVTQLEAFPVPVRRRGRTQVHDDVEDRAVRAPDELRLAVPAAHVQAAHHTADRAGEAILGEGRVDAGRTHYLRIEGAGEEAALVHVRGGHEEQSARNALNRLDVHKALL